MERPRLEYWLQLAECRDEVRQHTAGLSDGGDAVQSNWPAGTSLELEFPGGMLLRVPSETTSDCLRRVVELLSQVTRMQRNETQY